MLPVGSGILIPNRRFVDLRRLAVSLGTGQTPFGSDCRKVGSDFCWAAVPREQLLRDNWALSSGVRKPERRLGMGEPFCITAATER
jgi:hypothetical protein